MSSSCNLLQSKLLAIVKVDPFRKVSIATISINPGNGAMGWTRT
jgi:hypothetical protein